MIDSAIHGMYLMKLMSPEQAQQWMYYAGWSTKSYTPKDVFNAFWKLIKRSNNIDDAPNT